MGDGAKAVSWPGKLPTRGRFYHKLAKVSFGYMGFPCRCACLHCKGRGGGGAGERRPPDRPRRPVDTATAIAVARRVDDWRHERGYDLMITFGGADTPDYPGIFDELRFVKRLYGRDGFACNGMRMRTQEELDAWFARAYEAGARTVFTSFYGTREFHDRFAGREGDFDLMLRTVRASHRAGMRNFHTLFVSKSTTPYLEELTTLLDAMPEAGAVAYRPILNKTDVLTDESERYTKSEYAALPRRWRTHCGYAMKTRSEWRDAVLAGEVLESVHDYEHLDVRFDIGDMDLDAYWATSVEDFLDEAIGREVDRRDRTPGLVELARLYGGHRAGSDLVFSLFDMHCEWMYLWRREHPGFVPAYGLFRHVSE